MAEPTNSATTIHWYVDDLAASSVATTATNIPISAGSTPRRAVGG